MRAFWKVFLELTKEATLVRTPLILFFLRGRGSVNFVQFFLANEKGHGVVNFLECIYFFVPNERGYGR